MTNRRLARPVLAMTLAIVAALWLITDAHWGIARLAFMLVFLLVGPGAAAVALWLREIGDVATEAVLVVAASISLDIAVAQGMVWVGEWRPSTGVLCLAVLTVLMGAAAILRHRGRLATGRSDDSASE